MWIRTDHAEALTAIPAFCTAHGYEVVKSGLSENEGGCRVGDYWIIIRRA
jgi:hypothetical protein